MTYNRDRILSSLIGKAGVAVTIKDDLRRRGFKLWRGELHDWRIFWIKYPKNYARVKFIKDGQIFSFLIDDNTSIPSWIKRPTDAQLVEMRLLELI